MSSTRGWRTLVRLKERRLEQLDAALDAARAQARQRQQQLEALTAEADGCRAREDAQRAKLEALAGTAAGFRPSDLVTLQHLLEEATRTTLAAAKRVRDGERQVEAAQQAEQDDQQDEEAEEASVARLLAARPDRQPEAA